MNSGDSIDSTIDNWLSANPISKSLTNNNNNKKNKSVRKSKKSSKNFNIDLNLQPKMGLDDLPTKGDEIIEKASPNYRWSSFADADSLGMGMDDGLSSDLRGFAGE